MGLCVSGCFAMSIPGILNGTVAGTLVVKCMYREGEEGHRKFLCRGPDRRRCVRVIETALGAGQEVRRGRVTLKDSPSEHMFLVVMKDLEVGDADTYWCGVDKNVPQVPVAVTVFPGNECLPSPFAWQWLKSGSGSLWLRGGVGSSPGPRTAFLGGEGGKEGPCVHAHACVRAGLRACV